MATVSDFVTAALREIGVAAEDEAVTADAMSQGVDVYNRMLHGWAAKGADVSHVNQVSSDTVALADKYHEATIYLLAAKLAGQYRRPINFNPNDHWKTILDGLTTIAEATMPLLNMPSQRNRSYQTPEY